MISLLPLASFTSRSCSGPSPTTVSFCPVLIAALQKLPKGGELVCVERANGHVVVRWTWVDPPVYGAKRRYACFRIDTGEYVCDSMLGASVTSHAVVY